LAAPQLIAQRPPQQDGDSHVASRAEEASRTTGFAINEILRNT